MLLAVETTFRSRDDVQFLPAGRSPVGLAVAVAYPRVDAVASVAESVTGDRIYRRSATGGGDAKKLRNASIPTVEFALGTDTLHAVDEYTTVDAPAGNASIYARLPYAYADRFDAAGR